MTLPPFLFDGTWTPYFYDPRMFLILEVITFLIETFMIFLFNEGNPKEKRWTNTEIVGIVFIANAISFLIGMAILPFLELFL